MRVPFYLPLPPLLSERLCVDLVHLLCMCVCYVCKLWDYLPPPPG